MTKQEAIEILLDMANELQLIPESKQGQAFKIALSELKRQAEIERLINSLDAEMKEGDA